MCVAPAFGSSHVKTPSQLASLFADSSLAHDTQTLLLSMPPPSLLPPTLQPTSFVRSFTTLLSRSALANARNTAYIRAQIAKNIIVGALAGCIFFGQGKLAESVFDVNSNLPTAAGYNVVSILYFALLYAITGNLQAIPQICAAKVLFLRERSAGAYTTFPFFCSNALVYLPLIIFTHVFFTNLTYWLVQLPISWTIISYLFVATLLVNIISFYFSQLLAFLCSSSQVSDAPPRTHLQCAPTNPLPGRARALPHRVHVPVELRRVHDPAEQHQLGLGVGAVHILPEVGVRGTGVCHVH